VVLTSSEDEVKSKKGKRKANTRVVQSPRSSDMEIEISPDPRPNSPVGPTPGNAQPLGVITSGNVTTPGPKSGPELVDSHFEIQDLRRQVIQARAEIRAIQISHARGFRDVQQGLIDNLLAMSSTLAGMNASLDGMYRLVTGTMETVDPRPLMHLNAIVRALEKRIEVHQGINTVPDSEEEDTEDEDDEAEVGTQLDQDPPSATPAG
jgi:hypothetical protein